MYSGCARLNVHTISYRVAYTFTKLHDRRASPLGIRIQIPKWNIPLDGGRYRVQNPYAKMQKMGVQSNVYGLCGIGYAKTAEQLDLPFGMVSGARSCKESRALDRRTYRCQLANTIERLCATAVRYQAWRCGLLPNLICAILFIFPINLDATIK